VFVRSYEEILPNLSIFMTLTMKLAIAMLMHQSRAVSDLDDFQQYRPKTKCSKLGIISSALMYKLNQEMQCIC